MPSSRRLKLLSLAAITIFIIFLYYYSSDARQYTRQRQKYMQQIRLMNEKDRENAEAARGVSERLKEAEGQAKRKANMKSPPPTRTRNVGGNEEDSKGRPGSKEVKGNKIGEGGGEKGVDGGGVLKEQTNKEKKKVKELSIKEENQLELESLLTAILKRSPIIIFSKTYCPYSRKAKDILLNKYIITPPPHVVELDKIPEGLELQDYLKEKTGRNTVPIVLVNGKSIGGGDEIQDLHESGELMDLLLKMGGKRFMKMQKRRE